MRIPIAALSLALLAACAANKDVAQNGDSAEVNFAPRFATGPPAIVYKTKGDYFNLVPVFLSDDKSEIISYPDPADMKTGNDYPLPMRLHGGYLLDNRGIGINVAFLKMTYGEYAKLEHAPSLSELKSLIIDNDPLTELCDCGNKTAFSDIAAQLNAMIDGNTLRSRCKALK
jgi:hypothetical protein